MTYRTVITPTEEDIKKFKAICEKEGIKYDTEAEYRDAAQNLLNFAALAYDMAKEDLLRKKRLDKEPKGFEMDGNGRLCWLCSNAPDKIWYDKWGMKCLDCQTALDKKIIPGYVFKDRDNEKHVTASRLAWKFDIGIQTVKKLLRQGKLKAREIPGNGTLVFLRKDNPNIVEVLETEKAQKRVGAK